MPCFFSNRGGKMCIYRWTAQSVLCDLETAMEALKGFRSWSFLSLLMVILFWVCTVPGEYAAARNITVGGKHGWRYGYNYSDWISRVGTVYVNDWLVFKYPVPTSNSMAHSVVQIQNKERYAKCNVADAIKLAGPTQGIGKGFHFKLKRVRHYFFACGLGNARHCTVGEMRFGILPVMKSG